MYMYSNPLGTEYAEQILKDPENLTLLLRLLEEFDFQIRHPTVRLLMSLLHYKIVEVQEAILSSPMGISKIMDLLGAKQEVIRNDAILLLSYLTRSNSQIQKIVAFEGAFERLMLIISEEGYSDGIIIVEDCITVMQNLLRGNSSNQAFYREANQVQSLVPFFDFKLSSSVKWSNQKTSNVLAMLLLVRCLVSPANSQQNVSACQKVMHQCRLLEFLCTFMFASGVPTPVLVESINTVAEVVRGNFVNQQFFDTVETPSTPPRSGILTILMCMVNEKQPLPLRLAALYCFQSYLSKNEVGQSKVINTLLPSSTETTVSAGQVLCAGLFGNDSLSIWMTAMSLSAALNSSQKPQLLRVQLSMQGKGQVTLLQQCSDILVNTPDLKPLSRVGLLVLLCTWLTECQAAVTAFLDNPVNIPYLTGMIEQHYNNETDQIIGGLCATLIGICLIYNDGSSPGYSAETLREIITRRINQDSFTQSFTQLSSTEYFIQASKQPQIQASSVGQIFFDYAFTVLFKNVSNAIQRGLDPMTKTNGEPAPGGQNHLSQSQLSASFEEHSSVVQQYKDLLQEQDKEIIELRRKCQELERGRAEDRLAFQSQLKEAPRATESVDNGELGKEIESLREASLSHSRLQESMRQELGQKDVLLERMRGENEQLRFQLSQQSQLGDKVSKLREEIEELRSENEALLTEKNYLDTQLSQQLSLSVSAPTSLGNEEKLREYEERLREFSEKNRLLEDERDKLLAHLANYEKKINESSGNSGKLNELVKKNESLEKEQEDLLVLLADNDAKLKRYRDMLKENGITLSPSEDEDDEEDESDDEDI